jgi:hypothetical protein
MESWNGGQGKSGADWRIMTAPCNADHRVVASANGSVVSERPAATQAAMLPARIWNDSRRRDCAGGCLLGLLI